MNKTIIISFLTFLIIGCVDKDQDLITFSQLENLKAENDSLRKIVAEIQTKYVFDSISIRDIPSYISTS